MVRRRFAELDKGSFTSIGPTVYLAYVLHFPGISKPLGLAATKRFYEMLYGAFPDLRHTVVEQISTRNKVVTLAGRREEPTAPTGWELPLLASGSALPASTYIRSAAAA